MGKSTARLFGKTPERPYLIDTPVGPSGIERLLARLPHRRGS
jgi:hypothetical protein